MNCAICAYELDEVLEVIDPANLVLILDYWCPQCHSTETKHIYANGTISTNYIKG